MKQKKLKQAKGAGLLNMPFKYIRGGVVSVYLPNVGAKHPRVYEKRQLSWEHLGSAGRELHLHLHLRTNKHTRLLKRGIMNVLSNQMGAASRRAARSFSGERGS